MIFDSLKLSWTDDPFQKVILAPFGEESFKILVALMLCLSVSIGFYLSKTYTKSKKDIKERIKFLNIFYYTFVPFAMVSAVIFGLSEGPLPNILLHFSTTTIAALLIIIIFKKVKDKKWKMPWKIITIFLSMILPMLFHSIQNQYSNITYANNHPEFDYLVVIGRFLENNTFLAHQGIFAFFLFVITCVVLYVFIFNWLLKNKKNKNLRESD